VQGTFSKKGLAISAEEKARPALADKPGLPTALASSVMDGGRRLARRSYQPLEGVLFLWR